MPSYENLIIYRTKINLETKKKLHKNDKIDRVKKSHSEYGSPTVLISTMSSIIQLRFTLIKCYSLFKNVIIQLINL